MLDYIRMNKNKLAACLVTSLFMIFAFNLMFNSSMVVFNHYSLSNKSYSIIQEDISNYKYVFDYTNYNNRYNKNNKIETFNNLAKNKKYFNLEDKNSNVREFKQVSFISDYYKGVEYELENVTKEGYVPFINILKLPSDINSLRSVKLKKQIFISIILPLIVRENENILQQRKRLIEIKKILSAQKTLNKMDQTFLFELSSSYLVDYFQQHKIDTINELLILIDVIPNSIAIAQAANETGWGTSRFAINFNALYGQYTFDKSLGTIPNKRDEGEKYLIRAFPNLLDSVKSYIKNLNTNLAYREFRKLRYELRDKGLDLDPQILVNKLDLYAKNKNYVFEIHSIISNNNLTKYDNLITINLKS